MEDMDGVTEGAATADLERAQTGELAQIEAAVSRATQALLAAQRADGHFVFELEADVSIPSEYILFKHFLGEPADAGLEAKIAAFIRRQQAAHDGWPLFTDGAFNISSSVKAYFALKAVGDSPEADHMRRARAAILAHGGAANANVFTRALLALFGALPWRGVPVMPVEILLLPRWFPFHMTKVSYWSRTVITPLVVVNALKPRAKNPRNVTIDELFVEPPDKVRHWPGAPQQKFPWTTLFGALDKALRWSEPYFPKSLRKRAIDKAVAFVEERLNGEDGLGAIFPAMTYSAMMFDSLGYGRQDPRMVQVMKAIDKLLVIRDDEAYCQPCVSPVWDTGLAAHALMEAGGEATRRRLCAPGSTGSNRCKSPMSPAIGPCGSRMCGRAAGPFNMPTPIIPMSTTPPSSRWRWTARRALDPSLKGQSPRRRLPARANGSKACKAPMAAGAPSIPIMTTII